MPWYECTVNAVGPASDASDTPAPVIYIQLTDTAGDFPANTWFYIANGIQNEALDVAIAAMNSQKHVSAGAVAPNPGNQPFTEIQRLYLMRT
jgi:hypothetical protein